jgi:MoaA/NifB/PqqE/SkfB family radical SAM enzyme
MRVLPERLNLSIGNLCWLRCPGCYSYFGQGPPMLDRIAVSVREFVGLGVDRVTISGGDPLRIAGLVDFLTRLRQLRVRSVKLDTVGTAFLPSQRTRYEFSLENVLEKLDVLALPLDGWSNASVGLFRTGRPKLYDETCHLLSCLDDCSSRCRIHVNTVLHRRNVGGVCAILQRLMSFRCVSHWSVFEYTSTDQATDSVNRKFRLVSGEFLDVRRRVSAVAEDYGVGFEIEFASISERLGRYLLINSDGHAWVPDHVGRTVPLGLIYGREAELLDLWAVTVTRLRVSQLPSTSESPNRFAGSRCN